MTSKQLNSNLVEKFCLVLIIFITSSLIYYLASKGFKSFFNSSDTLNFKDTVTFGLSVSSLALVLILYSDWREKYVAESLDKDLREIKAHVTDLNFIINRFPSSENEADTNERAEFFKIFWKLRLLNSNIKYSNLNSLNIQIENYLNTSHGFINSIQSKSISKYSKIENESKKLFDSLNESIELARKQNLKT